MVNGFYDQKCKITTILRTTNQVYNYSVKTKKKKLKERD